MSATLELQVRKGLFSLGWSGLSQLACLSIRFCGTLLLTRFLAPEVYGLFGTAIAVITLLEWVSDFGVMPALIRHPLGGTPDYMNTGWWISMGRGAMLAVVCCALAWPTAQFNRAPTLFPILLALSLRSLIVPLRSPAMPLLRRELNYRALFFDEVAQVIVATTVTLSMAWHYRSIWSFVAGTLAGVATGVVMSYVLFPARPKLGWNRSVAVELSQFGRQVYLNTLVAAFWMSFDRLVGLRFIDLEKMGNYNAAWNLALVLDTLTSRACDVYFSMLSRQLDPVARAEWHKEVSRRIARWLMPVMAVGVVLAPSVIRVVYDSRYAEARILFAFLVARAMIRSVGQLQFQCLLARGQIRSNTAAHGVALVVQLLLFLPLIRMWDVKGLAISNLIASIAYASCQTVLLRMRGEGGLFPLLATLGWMSLGLLVVLSIG